MKSTRIGVVLAVAPPSRCFFLVLLEKTQVKRPILSLPPLLFLFIFGRRVVAVVALILGVFEDWGGLILILFISSIIKLWAEFHPPGVKKKVEKKKKRKKRERKKKELIFHAQTQS